MEYRSVQGSMKDVDAKRHEVNMIFPHEVPDTFRTVFLPETFVEGFGQRLPAMCWQHNLREPIGRVVEAQSTRQGNEVVSRFSRFDESQGGAPVPLAYRAFSQIQDGDITDFSFGFNRTGPVKAWSGQRGITAFTKAHMQEVSPVTIGSIPGAEVTDLRGNEGGYEGEHPSRDEILVWKREGIIDDEAARNLLKLSLPEGYREHITLSIAVPAQAGGGEGNFDTRASEDTVLLVQACDAALDAAQTLFKQADVSVLDEDVQQGISLVFAAGHSIDEFLEASGIDDPDEDEDDDDDRGAAAPSTPEEIVTCAECGGLGTRDDHPVCPTCGGAGFLDVDGDPLDIDEGSKGDARRDYVEQTRAVLSSAARKALPKSKFAYIDSEGKGHYPIPDAAHVRNALARIAQGDEYGEEAKPKVLAAAKKMGIDADDRADVELEQHDESVRKQAELAALLAKRLGN